MLPDSPLPDTFGRRDCVCTPGANHWCRVYRPSVDAMTEPISNWLANEGLSLKLNADQIITGEMRFDGEHSTGVVSARKENGWNKQGTTGAAFILCGSTKQRLGHS